MVLGGFSQGACLAAEYALRHPAPFGGLLLYTGGFCGPQGTPAPQVDAFEATPVYLGTSDPDGWVPVWRVRETAAAFTALGASVELDVFEGMDTSSTIRRSPRGGSCFSGRSTGAVHQERHQRVEVLGVDPLGVVVGHRADREDSAASLFGSTIDSIT